jgi:hypothetical protein
MHLLGLVMKMAKNGPDGYLADIRAKYVRSIQLSVCHCLQM